jgi:hypothetical protein
MAGNIFGGFMRAPTKAPVLLRGKVADLDVDQAPRLAERLMATDHTCLQLPDPRLPAREKMPYPVP